jgi:hypothetical protein
LGFVIHSFRVAAADPVNQGRTGIVNLASLRIEGENSLLEKMRRYLIKNLSREKKQLRRSQRSVRLTTIHVAMDLEKPIVIQGNMTVDPKSNSGLMRGTQAAANASLRWSRPENMMASMLTDAIAFRAG